jgi:hypothetical protein
MKYNHTELSLAGNVPVSRPMTAQQGKGLWADIGGAIAGVAGGIAGSIGGPFGSAAAGAASSYGAKKFLEQQGFGYQYKSPPVKSGLFGFNATGPVSMNMPDR